MPESPWSILLNDAQADRVAFIAAHTRPARASLVPEVELLLADMLAPLWQGTGEALETLNVPPPYWGFAWAGGQGLARYVLDHPQSVRGKTVLDFASGSGLVAIAACLCGAKRVLASEIDSFAISAIGLNATRNSVFIEPLLADLLARPFAENGDLAGVEVILAGDIFYERDIAGPLFDWLKAAALSGCTVLIGDPGRYYLPHAGLEGLAEYTATTSTQIEDQDVKRTRVWQVLAS